MESLRVASGETESGCGTLKTYHVDTNVQTGPRTRKTRNEPYDFLPSLD